MTTKPRLRTAYSFRVDYEELKLSFNCDGDVASFDLIVHPAVSRGFFQAHGLATINFDLVEEWAGKADLTVSEFRGIKSAIKSFFEEEIDFGFEHKSMKRSEYVSGVIDVSRVQARPRPVVAADGNVFGKLF